MLSRVLRLKDTHSKLAVESFAPERTAARTGAIVQERRLPRAIQDGLPPLEHVDVAFSLDSPLSQGKIAPR